MPSSSSSSLSQSPSPSLWEFGPRSLLALTAGYAIIEPISYKLIPALSTSATVKEYYNHKKIPFGVVASGDYLYSVLLFLVAQQVIPVVFGAQAMMGWMDWLARYVVFMVVQVIGDFSWYKFVTALPPVTKYIDFFQRYTQEVSYRAIFADSLYGICWFSVAQVIASYVPSWIQVFLIVAFLFGGLVYSY